MQVPSCERERQGYTLSTCICEDVCVCVEGVYTSLSLCIIMYTHIKTKRDISIMLVR